MAILWLEHDVAFLGIAAEDPPSRVFFAFLILFTYSRNQVV